MYVGFCAGRCQQSHVSVLLEADLLDLLLRLGLDFLGVGVDQVLLAVGGHPRADPGVRKGGAGLHGLQLLVHLVLVTRHLAEVFQHWVKRRAERAEATADVKRALTPIDIQKDTATKKRMPHGVGGAATGLRREMVPTIVSSWLSYVALGSTCCTCVINCSCTMCLHAHGRGGQKRRGAEARTTRWTAGRARDCGHQPEPAGT